MAVRSFMIDRFNALSKKNVVIAVEPDADKGTVDICFSNKVTLRVTNEEFAVLESRITVVDPEAGEGE